MKRIAALVFEDFELLDMFGPLEMFGLLPEHFEICMVAENLGSVASAQGPKTVVDASFDDKSRYDIILVPGGRGTRTEINNTVLLAWLVEQNKRAKYMTSVCTGSALLAKSGVLAGSRATTNKRAFTWVTEQGSEVEWIKQARWVVDGRFYTASGVSAGIDMSLGLIQDILGKPISDQVAEWSEYDWHSDKDWDPFAAKNGLV